MLSGSGIFNGTLPVVFNPGLGTVEVYFNGPTVTWTVKSYESSTLSTVTTSANSSSTRCTIGSRFIDASIDENKIRVFPNPTSGILNVSIPSLSTINSIQVYDLVGKLILLPVSMENDNVKFDCSSLNQGVYLIKINLDGSEELIKFVKE